MNESTVAVLGTLAEFHPEPVPYDLEALIRLVDGIHPDLLCLDMTPEEWAQRDFSQLPPEYGEALLPLANQTDMVVVPIGGWRPAEGSKPGGWRGALIQLLRRWLAWLQRTATGPEGINQGWRHHLGNMIYAVIRGLSGAEIVRHYHDRIHELSRRVEEIALHNPGNRILVVTNIQYCHHIRPYLQRNPQLKITTYDRL